MKLCRITLVCTLLLLAAIPTFAEPTCTECLDASTCINAPGIPSRCRFVGGVCETLVTSNCVGRSEAPVLVDWKVASIEVSRPSHETEKVVTTTPTAIAQAGTPVPAAK